MLDSLKNSGNNAFIPWAWGINGIFSVLAPLLSVGVSVTAGISTLLVSVSSIYVLVGFVFPVETSANATAPNAPSLDQELTLSNPEAMRGVGLKPETPVLNK